MVSICALVINIAALFSMRTMYRRACFMESSASDIKLLLGGFCWFSFLLGLSVAAFFWQLLG